MAEHTPGPWELTAHEDRFEIAMGTALDTSRIGYEPQHMIRLDWDTDDGGDDELAPQVDEAWANARLIAAAPDLLAALYAAQAAFAPETIADPTFDPHGVIERDEAVGMILAAIAKARGEAPRAE